MDAQHLLMCMESNVCSCAHRAANTPIARLPLNLLSVILDRAAPLVPFISEVEGVESASTNVADHPRSLVVKTTNRQKPWLVWPAGLVDDDEIF